MLTDYLALLPTPEDEKRFVDKSMQLSGLICEAMQRHGLTQRALAERLGKKESEVSRWLSGLHNFTLKTLTRIEAVLGEDLVLVFRDNQPKAVELKPRNLGQSSVKADDRWAPAPFQSVTINSGKGAGTAKVVTMPEFTLTAA